MMKERFNQSICWFVQYLAKEHRWSYRNPFCLVSQDCFL